MRNAVLQKNAEQQNKMFNDVADEALRANNRAAMMANLYEEFGNGGKKTTPFGLAQVMRYFKAVPQEDRPLTLSYFKAALAARGLQEA